MHYTDSPVTIFFPLITQIRRLESTFSLGISSQDLVPRSQIYFNLFAKLITTFGTIVNLIQIFFHYKGKGWKCTFPGWSSQTALLVIPAYPHQTLSLLQKSEITFGMHKQVFFHWPLPRGQATVQQPACILTTERDCKPRIFIQTSYLSTMVTEHIQNIVCKI